MEGGEGRREGGRRQGGKPAIIEVEGLEGGRQGGRRKRVKLLIVGEVEADEEGDVGQGSIFHLSKL